MLFYDSKDVTILPYNEKLYVIILIYQNEYQSRVETPLESNYVNTITKRGYINRTSKLELIQHNNDYHTHCQGYMRWGQEGAAAPSALFHGDRRGKNCLSY